MGNRTQKTDSATGTETYSTDAANRLLSVSSGNPNNGAYTNDASGNTLTGGGRVNTWDSQNRLVKVVKAGVTSEFVYGCDGLRRRSLVTNAAGESTKTDYAYDGQSMVAEVVRHYTGGAQMGQTENVSYLQGPSGPLYRKSSLQADPKWYVYDGLGSVVGEVDVLGNLSATKAHDVYGLTRNVTGNPISRQGFVGGLGHISDDETGLVYMRARYYDPSLGRFESQDSAKSGGNWLIYCANDPVNMLDPSGNDPVTIGTVLIVLLFLAVTGALFGLGFYLSKSALQGSEITGSGALWAMAEGAVGGLVLAGLGCLLGMSIGTAVGIGAFLGVALLGFAAGILIGAAFGGMEGKAAPAQKAAAIHNATLAIAVALCDAG